MHIKEQDMKTTTMHKKQHHSIPSRQQQAPNSWLTF